MARTMADMRGAEDARELNEAEARLFAAVRSLGV